MASSPEYQGKSNFRWKNPNENLSEILASMKKDTTFSDLIFVCQGGNNDVLVNAIYAHKAVFSSASKFLQELFQIAHEKQPYEKVVISLDSVEPIILEKLIEYMYKGKTIVDQKQKEKLLALCNYLHLEALLKHFESPLSVGNSATNNSEIFGQSLKMTCTANMSNTDLYSHCEVQYETLPLKEDSYMSDIYLDNCEVSITNDSPDLIMSLCLTDIRKTSNMFMESEKRILRPISKEIGRNQSHPNNDSSTIDANLINECQVMHKKGLNTIVKRNLIKSTSNNPKKCTKKNTDNHLEKAEAKCKNPVRCKFCGDYPSTHMKRHIQAVHDQIRPHNCVQCDYSAATVFNLKSHVRAVHLKLKSISCSKCDYSTFYKYYLKIHEKAVHLKTKDILCSKCDFSTSTKNRLKVHDASVHLKIKNHKCNHCKYKCCQKSRLKKHIVQKHTEIV